MEKYQSTDQHKFILYSAKIGEQTPQMTRRADEGIHANAATPQRVLTESRSPCYQFAPSPKRVLERCVQ